MNFQPVNTICNRYNSATQLLPLLRLLIVIASFSLLVSCTSEKDMQATKTAAARINTQMRTKEFANIYRESSPGFKTISESDSRHTSPSFRCGWSESAVVGTGPSRHAPHHPGPDGRLREREAPRLSPIRRRTPGRRRQSHAEDGVCGWRQRQAAVHLKRTGC
jgi:hypothetical protein